MNNKKTSFFSKMLAIFVFAVIIVLIYKYYGFETTVLWSILYIVWQIYGFKQKIDE